MENLANKFSVKYAHDVGVSHWQVLKMKPLQLMTFSIMSDLLKTISYLVREICTSKAYYGNFL